MCACRHLLNPHFFLFARVLLLFVARWQCMPSIFFNALRLESHSTVSPKNRQLHKFETATNLGKSCVFESKFKCLRYFQRTMRKSMLNILLYWELSLLSALWLCDCDCVTASSKNKRRHMESQHGKIFIGEVDRERIAKMKEKKSSYIRWRRLPTVFKSCKKERTKEKCM